MTRRPRVQLGVLLNLQTVMTIRLTIVATIYRF